MKASRPGPIWALVPVKGFARGKSRLQSVLPPDERAAFARSLLERTLLVLGRSPSLARTVVVSSDPAVAAVAESSGALVLPDEAPPPLGAIVDAALARLGTLGAGAALVLMSDLPELAPDDVAALCALLGEHELVVAPNAQEDGTNALGLVLPARHPTSFGLGDSFRRHLLGAEEAGLRAAIYRHPRVAFDVDGPEDLAQLKGR